MTDRVNAKGQPCKGRGEILIGGVNLTCGSRATLTHSHSLVNLLPHAARSSSAASTSHAGRARAHTRTRTHISALSLSHSHSHTRPLTLTRTHGPDLGVTEPARTKCAAAVPSRGHQTRALPRLYAQYAASSFFWRRCVAAGAGRGCQRERSARAADCANCCGGGAAD